jgi:hypothetical protein
MDRIQFAKIVQQDALIVVAQIPANNVYQDISSLLPKIKFASQDVSQDHIYQLASVKPALRPVKHVLALLCV